MSESAAGLSAPDPLALRAFARPIPHDRIPARIGEMNVTESLLEDYRGHENLLRLRAMHSSKCYREFDAMRLCLLGMIDGDRCEKVVAAYAPCDEDLRRQALARRMTLEDERRKQLAAQAKISAGGSGSDKQLSK